MIGELSALMAAILWSISPYIFSQLVSKIGSYSINVARSLVSSILIFLSCLILNIQFNTSLIQLVLLILSGIIGIIFGDTFLFKSLKEIGPRYTMILMSSNPAFAAIFAYFILDEKISWIGIIGMFITFLGISLVVYQHNDKEITKFKITNKGIFFGILSSMGQASGLILTKIAYLYNEIYPLTATFYRIFPSFLMLFTLGIIYSRINSNFFKNILNKKILGLLILGSIIGPYLGITFSFVAVTHIQVGIAATIMSLQPILMLPISKYIQKEKLSTQSVVGAFLTVFGIAILFLRNS